MGEGQPEAHDPYANNQFLDTRGLPGPTKSEQGTAILERVAELSRPFGTTLEMKGDTADVKVKGGK